MSKKLRLDKSKSLSTASAKLQGVQDITKEMRLDEVLKVCQKDLGQCRYIHIASLCENFVYVVHPSYIDKARAKMDSITSIADGSRGRLGVLEKALKLVLETKHQVVSDPSEHPEEDGPVVHALAKFASLEKIETRLLELRSNILKIQENNLKVSFARLVAFQKTFMAYVAHTKKTLEGVDRNLIRVYQQQHLLLKKCYQLDDGISEEDFSKLEKLRAILAQKFNSKTSQLVKQTKKVGWVVGNFTGDKVAATSKQQIIDALSQINKNMTAAVKKDVHKSNSKSGNSQVVLKQSSPKSSRGRILQYYGQNPPHIRNKSKTRRGSLHTSRKRRRQQNGTEMVPQQAISTVVEAPKPKPKLLVSLPPPSSTSDFCVIRDTACLFGCVSLQIDLMGP